MAKRRLNTILSLAEQNSKELSKPKQNIDFSNVIINAEVVILNKNSSDEISLIKNDETENSYVGGTLKFKDITDKNNLLMNFEGFESVVNLEELIHDSDFINLDTTDLMIDNENTVIEVTENIEVHSSNCTNQDDSSTTLDVEEINESDSNRITGEKRKRSLKKNTNTWKREVTKKKRMLGEAYIGYSRQGKTVEHNSNRNERSMKAACSSKKCQSLKNRFCQQFDEEMRGDIFKKYWSATWEENICDKYGDKNFEKKRYY